MKKNVIVVSFLLFTIILQSCGHVSKETAFLNTSAQWAKKDPGGFVEKGYIGIGVKLNTDDEIEIIHVADGSPAKKEGIKPGDIILEIDSIPIKDKYQAFKIYDSKYPGDFATVVLRRHGEVLTRRLQDLPSFYSPTVIYSLMARVYKGLPIRLAVIPEELSVFPPALETELKAVQKDGGLELKKTFEGMFLQAFDGHDNFAIVDRQNVEKVFNEMKFQQSGVVSDESRVKIGHMLGATHLMLMHRSWNLQGNNEMIYIMSIEIIEVEGNRKIATTAFKESTTLKKEAVDYIRNSDLRKDLLAYHNSRIGKVNDSEQEALKAYEGVIGNNYRNDEIWIRVPRSVTVSSVI